MSLSDQVFSCWYSFCSYLDDELVMHVYRSDNVCFYDFSSRVFLLGPSHHYYTPKCALSRATVYKTPVGDLQIDLEGIVSFVLVCSLFPSFSILCLFFFFFRSPFVRIFDI